MLLALLAILVHAPSASRVAPGELLVERITSKPPFPRGLQLVDGKLYVLCRGRVREYGGVSADLDDQAGTLYVVDPNVSEVYSASEPGAAVRDNGTVLPCQRHRPSGCGTATPIHPRRTAKPTAPTAG
jgi:hypothetical protein